MKNCKNTEQSLRLPVLYPAFKPTHYFFGFVRLTNYFIQLKQVFNVPTKRIRQGLMHINISLYRFPKNTLQ